MKFKYVNAYQRNSYVTDSGSRGRCYRCQRVWGETTFHNKKNYCRECFSQEFPENQTAKFETTDAKFKCPLKRCNADKLSYDEQFIGSCCKPASVWTQKNGKHQHLDIVNKIFQKAIKEENEAEVKAETDDNNVDKCGVAVLNAAAALKDAEKEAKDAEKKAKDAQKKAKDAQKKAKDAEKRAKDAQEKAKESHNALDKQKKWRKICQKRVLFVAKFAAEEDNSDIEEPANKRPCERADESNDCTICFEEYAEDDRQKAAIIPCGHQACFGCLSSLPVKSCPTCRVDFTDDKILKLF